MRVRACMDIGCVCVHFKEKETIIITYHNLRMVIFLKSKISTNSKNNCEPIGTLINHWF
jgi:hypothetical protein